MKKILTGLLFGMLIFSAMPVFAEFSDVTQETKYKTAIEYLQEKNIVQGDAEKNIFRPYDTINRAEFLKIVLLAGNHSVPEFFEGCFPDISGEEWFAKYVCYAKEKGFVNGREDGEFYPADEISFVEAAKILVEVLGLDTELVEVSENVEWYEKYVKALTETKKAPRTVVSFEYKVKRNDMAEMVWRVLEEQSLRDGDDWVGEIRADWVGWKEIKKVFAVVQKDKNFEITIYKIEISKLENIIFEKKEGYVRFFEDNNFNLVFLADNESGAILPKKIIIKDKKSNTIYLSNKSVWDAVPHIDGKHLFIGWREDVLPQETEKKENERIKELATFLNISEKNLRNQIHYEGVHIPFGSISFFSRISFPELKIKGVSNFGGEEISVLQDEISFTKYLTDKNSFSYSCESKFYYPQGVFSDIKVVKVDSNTLKTIDSRIVHSPGDINNYCQGWSVWGTEKKPKEILLFLAK